MTSGIPHNLLSRNYSFSGNEPCTMLNKLVLGNKQLHTGSLHGKDYPV